MVLSFANAKESNDSKHLSWLVGNPRLCNRAQSLYLVRIQNLTQAKQKYVGYLVSVLCIIVCILIPNKDPLECKAIL